MMRSGLGLAVLLALLPGSSVSAADTTPAAATAAAPAKTAVPAAASMAAASSTAQPAATLAPAGDQPMANPSIAVPSALPSRGMDMANVEHIYGTPLEKLAPVPAKGTPTHPPITRWIYPTFVVYFEYNHVIHAVTKAHPFKDTGNDQG